jgi:RNA polymerase sigma-70 factor, ECF subfamily
MSRQDDLYDTATRLFPASWVRRDEFSEYVQARVPLPDQLPAESAAALYLACACVRGVGGAIERFEAEYLPHARRAAARTGLTPEQVGDLLQTVRERLLVRRGDRAPQLAEYQGRGDLAGWLRVVVTRDAIRLRKRTKSSEATQVNDLEQRASDDDPELAYMKALYRELFRAAFRSAVSALDPKDKLVLHQSSVLGWSIDELGKVHGVHRATAARWIQSAREKLLGSVRRELAAQAKVSPRELNSILKLVQSRFDVTMRRLLG